MKLAFKLLIPLGIFVVVLGGINFLIVHSKLHKMENHFMYNLANNKAQEIYSEIDILGKQALRQAALFASLPEVIHAFKIAHKGNINDESDPNCQQAREMLREVLKYNLYSFKQITGKPFKIHYHLPNGRSLVRLWRKKQAKRNGSWVDISDDISSFRHTVLDVNRLGKPIYGIELGRGGFVIRGIAPIKSNGKQLGSVEVLLDFEPLLKSISKGKNQSVLLYMDADKLNITTRLQDSKKYPVINNEFVLVSGNKKYLSLIDIDLLRNGQKRLSLENKGYISLAAFPVFDYKGKEIGTFVYVYNNKFISQSISSIFKTFTLIMLGLVIIPGIIIYVLTSIFVVKPISNMIKIIKGLTQDKADLKERLNINTKDEIGLLAYWFNKLMDKINNMMNNIAQYKYIIESISDPIFCVDKDYNIVLANKATAKIAGKNSGDEIKGRKCKEIFNTKICNSDECAVNIVKKGIQYSASQVVEIKTNGRKRFIKPIADIVKDIDGNIIGYMEIAQDVTSLVEKEKELEKKLLEIEEMNHKIHKTAINIAEMGEGISIQIEKVREGTQIQKQKVMETAAAMEQMSSAILEVAKNTTNTSLQVSQTKERAEKGAAVVSDLIHAISEVNKISDILKQDIDKLGKQAESIGEIMNIISDIADQTNLLALNAAIEAARAGEAGRGFAVVADEVRKLAEKTMMATKEVGDAIEAIQKGIHKNINNTEKATKAVEKAKEFATLSGNALKEIVELIQDSSVKVDTIAAASEQQSATAEEINKAVEEISVVSSNTAEQMEEAANTLSELLHLAERLKNI